MTEEISLQELNLSLIKEYMDFKTPGRAYRDILKYYANEVTKPIPECDELDVTRFLERHCKKGGSWNSCLSTLRQLYSWLTNKDKHLPMGKWKPPAFFDMIEWKDATSDKYNVSDMWTEEEILMAISACDHPRDKAAVALGYDVAGRPTELEKIRIRDVVLKENFGRVRLLDHTGERHPYITLSFEYVRNWLNCHPLKDNPDAPLFVGLRSMMPKAVGQGWLYDLCVKQLKPKLQHRIKKPFNPYCIFDHSRLTNLAEQGFSDTDLKAFRNWSVNSAMPKRYIRMTGKGVGDRLLELAGIKQREAKDIESPLRSKQCYKCKHRNAPDVKFCVKCNFMLSPEAWEELQKEEADLKSQVGELREQMDQVHRELARMEKSKPFKENEQLSVDC